MEQRISSIACDNHNLLITLSIYNSYDLCCGCGKLVEGLVLIAPVTGIVHTLLWIVMTAVILPATCKQEVLSAITCSCRTLKGMTR